jgi:hypothetical protein
VKHLEKRVSHLEAKEAPPPRRVHSIIQHIGQTQDDALDAYGRDLVGEGDMLIVTRIV